MPDSPQASPNAQQRVRIVVATSVMLTFISFWRAAAIVLNDLGSSAFYARPIAEQAVGKAAPWFILGVMLFAFTVRAVYVVSCSMFVRGGVYRVVKEALGGGLAKVSVSALMFDYILTGPISGVSAGHYISGWNRVAVPTACRQQPAGVAQGQSAAPASAVCRSQISSAYGGRCVARAALRPVR